MSSMYFLIMNEDLGIDTKKVEFKTFTVADESGSYTCEWDYLKKSLPEYAARVEAKVAELGGESGYIGIHSPNDVGTSYFEIQWD